MVNTAKHEGIESSWAPLGSPMRQTDHGTSMYVVLSPGSKKLFFETADKKKRFQVSHGDVPGQSWYPGQSSPGTSQGNPGTSQDSPGRSQGSPGTFEQDCPGTPQDNAGRSHDNPGTS